jgi:hypothetical protein
VFLWERMRKKGVIGGDLYRRSRGISRISGSAKSAP